MKTFSFRQPAGAGTGRSTQRHTQPTHTVWLHLGALMFGFICAPAAFAQDAADNVVIILDSSGSMARPMAGTDTDKMTAAKAALKQVLQSVPRDTHIGLLVFSAQRVKNDWVYPLGPRDDAKLMEAIDLPLPGRDTPLGKYLKKGADRLLQERAKQFGYGSFRLLVVTDGEAQDQDLVDKFTPEIIARGITVDVIGVAMNRRHTLATKVHSYRSANDPTSLKRAVAEVFAEIGGHASDMSDAEVFAELKPIPAETAQAMIQALSSSGNQPIGERPPPAPRPAALPQGNSGGQSVPLAQAPASPVADHPIQTGITRVVAALGGMACVGVVGILVLVLIVRAAKNARR